MKFRILLLVSVVASISASSQSLGVGTTTPNPNAVLHVNSATNNQGLLIPRMTTAQRTAAPFTSALSTADIGLMVYDTDLLRVYTWEGSGWDTPSIDVTVIGTGSAGYFEVDNVGSASPAIYATTNGTGSPSTTAAIIGETATAFSAITGLATGGAANALTGIVSDPGAGGYAVLGSVSATGGGQAGVFNISNTTNSNNTLEASTNGTGGAAKFTVNNVLSTKPALWAETNSNQPLSAPIYGLNTGTGDVAASFKITNTGNNFPALFAETNSKMAARFVKTAGTGSAVYIDSQAGGGLFANHNGSTGYAGIIQSINAANTTPALFVEAVGTGASLWVNKDPGETGITIESTHQGASGSAGVFSTSDATNTGAAVSVSSNSSANGVAISANQTGIGDAVFATATNGSAGNFQVNTGTGNYSALFAMTNSATGTAAGAMNTANGSAFSIFQGGMKVSTAILNGGSTITERAVAYQITGGSAYTFSLTPVLSDGEMFYMYNSSPSPVTVEGANINANSGLLFIVLGGTPRPF